MNNSLAEKGRERKSDRERERRSNASNGIIKDKNNVKPIFYSINYILRWTKRNNENLAFKKQTHTHTHNERKTTKSSTSKISVVTDCVCANGLRNPFTMHDYIDSFTIKPAIILSVCRTIMKVESLLGMTNFLSANSHLRHRHFCFSRIQYQMFIYAQFQEHTPTIPLKFNSTESARSASQNERKKGKPNRNLASRTENIANESFVAVQFAYIAQHYLKHACDYYQAIREWVQCS